jgi:hypothetical protein
MRLVKNRNYLIEGLDMKRPYCLLAGILAALACITAAARTISIDTPSYFPPPTHPGPGFAFPFLASDSASLTITEPDTSFVYRFRFAPGTKKEHSAAGTSLGASLPNLPSSNCASTYYTGSVYPSNPTYICVAYMLNWGPAPNEPPGPGPFDPIDSQVMVYQFDNAAAIARGNCASGACSPALSLTQPDGAVAIIEDPEDVIEVDFNYAAASCKHRTASFTVNDRTYTYAGGDLCHDRNAFFFYVSGGEAVLLRRPTGWTSQPASP